MSGTRALASGEQISFRSRLETLHLDRYAWNRCAGRVANRALNGGFSLRVAHGRETEPDAKQQRSSRNMRFE